MKTARVLMVSAAMSLLTCVANAAPRDARDALELFYSKTKKLGTVTCVSRRKGEVFVYCYPAGESLAASQGGLYAVMDEPLSVTPLNGKALSHMQGRASIEAVNGMKIKVLPATQELRMRVEEARGLFR